RRESLQYAPARHRDRRPDGPARAPPTARRRCPQPVSSHGRPGVHPMPTHRTRREFIQDLGIAPAVTPFLGNLQTVRFAIQHRLKQRLVIMFSPNGVVPNAFWPDAEGSLADMTLKPSLSPLEPFKSRLLTLHGVCDRVRGDGDAHMRGMGCLLTGVELFPGNV